MSVGALRRGWAGVGDAPARPLIIGMVAVALVLRLVMALTTRANGDIANELRAASWLVATPLHFYRREGAGLVWPDLSGYFPVVVVGRALHVALGVSFTFLMRLPVIAANMFLAWLVDSELRRMEVRSQLRLLALVTILFSPLLVFEAGWHAQIDMVSVSFAAAAFVVWERCEGDRRALGAGALLGIAGLIKPIPAVALIALLPHARTRRELVLLIGSAVAVVAAGIAPWAISEWHALLQRLDYQGVPGLGGLSLLIQPSLGTVWLQGHHVALSTFQFRVQAHARTISLIALGVAALWVLIRRPRPAAGAAMLFLAIYVSAANLSLQYLIWVLPFLFLAGWVRAAFVFQLVLIVPTLIVYIPGLEGTLGGASLWSTGVTYGVYVPIMDALWLAFGVAFLALAINTGRPLRRRLST